MTQLLEGKKSAAAIREETADIARERRESGVVPTLALVLATADESAHWYSRAITRAAEKVGVAVRLERLPDDASVDAVGSALRQLSADASVHGIILQVPLPPGVDAVQDATLTICHSRTQDLATVTREADVLVAAVGRPRMLGAEHVMSGAVVIDVGTTPDENGTLVGDVDTEAVMGRAGAVTPVPGGVGPVTTALLLRNTVSAAG